MPHPVSFYVFLCSLASLLHEHREANLTRISRDRRRSDDRGSLVTVVAVNETAESRF